MTRRDFCRALLESSPDINSLVGSTDDELLSAQYAVVVQRGSERWVRAAADMHAVADIELECLVGTEGYDEWVAEVWSLAHQRRCPYGLRIVVSIDASASAERQFRRR